MKTKQVPEDFVVEELIDLKTSETGDYTYFWLTKTNWTTVRAIREIARRCRVTFRRFKYAGTKDKFAVTKQAVSVFKVEPETLQQVNIKDIGIEIIGKGEQQISLGTLIGNRFEITVHDIEKEPDSKLIAEFGFPNYFGEQRFGGGNTHLVGREIIKGHLEQAARYILTYSEDPNQTAQEARAFASNNWGNWSEILKVFPKFLGLEKAVLNWLVKNPTDFAGAMRVVPKPIRKMYVHAYQSYLWNLALSEFLKANIETDMKAVGFSELAIPKYAKKDAKFLAELKDLECIVPGSETKLARSKFSKTMKEILENEGINLEDFACKRMPEIASEGTTRLAFVVPKEFIAETIDSKSMKVSFELPKGAYATVLLEVLYD